MVRPKNMTSDYPPRLAVRPTHTSSLSGEVLVSGYEANERFVQESTVEPEHIARARAHALELGAAPISPAVGAQIAVLAAASRALNVVEVGTGGGVSGLWLLHGSPRCHADHHR